ACAWGTCTCTSATSRRAWRSTATGWASSSRPRSARRLFRAVGRLPPSPRLQHLARTGRPARTPASHRHGPLDRRAADGSRRRGRARAPRLVGAVRRRLPHARPVGKHGRHRRRIASAAMDTRLLIGGERVAGNGPELAVEDPAREETIAAVGTPDPEQLDAAIEAARTAQREWAATPAAE